MSFDEHFRAAAHLAGVLRERLQVQTGDRVAIAMRNFPEWSVAFWAATAAGAVVVPLNAWWTGEELHYGLADSGTKVVFCDFERAERIADYITYLSDLAATVVVRPEGELPEGMLSYADVLGSVLADVSLPSTGVTTDDDATIFYTSGTTGRPQRRARDASQHLHESHVSLFYVNVRGGLRFGAARRRALSWGRLSYLLSVPLFHATGCHSILLSNIIAGGKLVMMHRWDAGRALELIERERMTTFGGVPTMVCRCSTIPTSPSAIPPA